MNTPWLFHVHDRRHHERDRGHPARVNRDLPLPCSRKYCQILTVNPLKLGMQYSYHWLLV